MDGEVLSPVHLSSFGLCREPPLPVGEPRPDDGTKFDSDTLFYDVFLSRDGQCITAICPPLCNCEPALAAAVFRLQPSGAVLQPSLFSHARGAVLRLSVPSGVAPSAMSMEMNGSVIQIPIRPAGTERFRNRKIIFAISKDNPLHWISDWATYNARVHGADAVLFYDNGSTRYGLADIEQTLRGVEGLQEVIVLAWNFPFGAAPGPNGETKTRYAQNCAIEHARWRYGAEASAFLNSDIDEMVVTGSTQSIFDRLTESGLPCLSYAGRWVSIVRPLWRKRASMVVGYRSGLDLRHSDCLFVEDEPPYSTKWVADPRACDRSVEWSAHEISGLTGLAAKAAFRRDPIDLAITFRHCRQAGLGWKYDRTGDLRYRIGLRYDRDFARALSRAFPGRHIFRQSGGLLRRAIDYLKQF